MKPKCPPPKKKEKKERKKRKERIRMINSACASSIFPFSIYVRLEVPNSFVVKIVGVVAAWCKLTETACLGVKGFPDFHWFNSGGGGNRSFPKQKQNHLTAKRGGVEKRLVLALSQTWYTCIHYVCFHTRADLKLQWRIVLAIFESPRVHTGEKDLNEFAV